jgi:hypothetical protein
MSSFSEAGENSSFDVDLHQLASVLGDIHGEMVLRVLPLVKLTPDEREQRAIDGLAQLRDHDLLTDAEADRLTAVIRSLHPDNGPPQAQAMRIRPLCDELQAASPSPVALGLAAVALDSVITAAEMAGGSAGAAAGDLNSAAQCDCAGAIIGATGGLVIGLGGGGPQSVLIGAVVGATVGSAAYFAAQSLLS